MNEFYKMINSIIKILYPVLAMFSFLIIYKIIIYLIIIDDVNFLDLLNAFLPMIGLSYDQNEIHLFFIFLTSYLLIYNLSTFKIRLIIKNITYGILIIWGIFRSLNIAAIIYTNKNIEKDFITHIDISIIKGLFNYKTLLFIIIPVVCFFIFKLFNNKLDKELYSKKRKIIISIYLIPLLFFLFLNVRLLAHTSSVKSQKYNYIGLCSVLKNLPEQDIIFSLRGNNDQKNFQDNIDKSIILKLKKFGLSVDTESQLPLYKKTIYKSELNYKKSNNFIKTPNIIIFVFESLSPRLIGVYGSKFENITPNIDSFSRESLIIKNCYNGSTPTLNGLISLLTSSYPVHGPEIYGSNTSDLKSPDLLSIMEILKGKGYNSFNITPGSPYYVNHNVFFEKEGVDRIFGFDEIRKKLNQDSYGKMFGVSDQQVVNFFIDWLQTRDETNPFFISLSTVDFHPPFDLPDDCVDYNFSNNKLLKITLSGLLGNLIHQKVI